MSDLISREETLEMIKQWIGFYDGAVFENDIARRDELAHIYSQVLKIPSAEAEWIPCSERLPKEEEKTYWVCTNTEYQCECRWTNNRFGLGEGEWGWSIFGTPQYSKPIAWRPLPEPYKAESEEV